ncbi:MAG: transposase [Sterolibacteriaceae bacterium]|nr:transposase [Sterolibacteriaceae bacterium]
MAGDRLRQPLPKAAPHAERIRLGTRRCAPATDCGRQCALRSRLRLVIDESAFAKKGDMSAGVACQWNGRLGKTDNSKVGVFAAVTRDRVAAVVEGDLYVPEEWFADPVRCEAAGIPEGLGFRTKGEMALAMIYRLRREGLRFAYTVFDAGYGHLPWLLRALDDERETFLAEVHSDQAIYLSDPAPAVPGRQSVKGKALQPFADAGRSDNGRGLGRCATAVALAPTFGARGREGRRRCRLPEAAGVAVGWHRAAGALVASAGAPRDRRLEVEVLPVQCQARGELASADGDAGGAAFRGTRVRGCQGRLRHGGLSGQGLRRLASSHGTRDGGADVPGQGASGQPRDGRVAVLQRSDRDHAAQAAHPNRSR